MTGKIPLSIKKKIDYVNNRMQNGKLCIWLKAKEMLTEQITIIDVICSECHAYMYDKPGYGESGVSHGICDVCYEELNDKLKRKCE